MMLILLIGQFTRVAQAEWTPPRRLTWTPYGFELPAIAIGSNGAIHIVGTMAHEIYYKKSTDGGETWTMASRVSRTTGWSEFAAIAIDSRNTLHVVWMDKTPGNYDIFYTRRPDGSTNWSGKIRLSWTPGVSLSPAISMDSENLIHVVWCDSTPPDWEIYYVRSTNRGWTWSVFQQITWNYGDSLIPALAIDSDDTIHVVWHDRMLGIEKVYYKKSSNRGKTWNPARRLTWISNDQYAWHPAIVVGKDNNVHVVWSQYFVWSQYPGYSKAETEIFYKRSSDGGAIWSTGQRLTRTSGWSESPSMAIDGDKTVHVVWADETPGNYEIYYAKGTAGGTIWSEAQRLTSTPGASGSPCIAIDSDDTIRVVWWDDTPGHPEIYYMRTK